MDAGGFSVDAGGLPVNVDGPPVDFQLTLAADSSDVCRMGV